MFLLEHWHLLSGGALGALFTGLVASNAWEKGIPRFASVGPSLQYSPESEPPAALPCCRACADGACTQRSPSLPPWLPPLPAWARPRPAPTSASLLVCLV
jgi:hypothetical protein